MTRNDIFIFSLSPFLPLRGTHREPYKKIKTSHPRHFIVSMKKIFYKKTLIGIRVRRLQKGSVPITDPKESVQVVGLKHPKGAYLKAHAHKPRRRVTPCLQEGLIVRKGKIKIDLYTPESLEKFKSITLKAGEMFLLLNGGYGIHILEDAEMFEFKNGPFLEDKVLIN